MKGSPVSVSMNQMSGGKLPGQSPVIIGGDFNATPDSPEMLVFSTSGGYFDTLKQTGLISQPTWDPEGNDNISYSSRSTDGRGRLTRSQLIFFSTTTSGLITAFLELEMILNSVTGSIIPGSPLKSVLPSVADLHHTPSDRLEHGSRRSGIRISPADPSSHNLEGSILQESPTPHSLQHTGTTPGIFSLILRAVLCCRVNSSTCRTPVFPMWRLPDGPAKSSTTRSSFIPRRSWQPVWVYRVWLEITCQYRCSCRSEGTGPLRGFPQDRFLDRVMAVSNLELRFPLIWRIGGVAGLDAGKVWNSPGDIDLEGWAVNKVAGLRFYMQTFVVRIDLGFGPETTGLYFNFGHVF